MKDEIENITKVLKEIARIRDVYQQRYPNSRTPDDLREIEKQLSDVRDLMNF